MREIIIESFGDPDVLQLRTDVPATSPGPGEVQVRVLFAGLNPLDYKIRDGSSPMAQQLQPPIGLGREMAGELVDAADDVDLEALGLERGALVFGMRRPSDRRGCYAEVITIAADDVAPVPDGVDRPDLPALGGLALAGLTAIAAVHDAAHIGQRDTVLIHGGSGGVGQLLIPIAREAGASHIWATGRSVNADRIRELGAEPIAYDQSDWQQMIGEQTDGRGVDVVLDTHYFSTFVPSLDVVADGGRIIPLPSLADLTPARERGIEAAIPQIVPGRERLIPIAAGFAEGRYPVEVSAVLPLAEVARGHRMLEEGHTRGKIVLEAHA